tara:strand:- start:68 stop:874 length:807 start_codon:yes stop_codon:yes gene_type:complete
MDCDKSPLMHKHHIIPRYMGGTDDVQNLVEVSITQHAMFHYCNYQLWNNIEDYVAWRGLSHQVSEAEFLIEKFKIFGKIGSDRLREKLKNNPQLREKIKNKQIESWNKNREKHIEKTRLHQPKAVEASIKPEARKRHKQKLKEINHQQGKKNSQYGTVWIFNLDLKENKKISKNEKILEGWNVGRIIDFDSHIKKLKKRELNKLNNKVQLENKIEYYEEMYELYLTEGFSYIRDELNYDRTRESLVMQFKKYVKSYIPYQKTKCCNGK